MDAASEYPLIEELGRGNLARAFTEGQKGGQARNDRYSPAVILSVTATHIPQVERCNLFRHALWA